MSTQILRHRTPTSLPVYLAGHRDHFGVDGSARLADVDGDPPEVGDLILVRRPTLRGRTHGTSKPRKYRVESTDTRETACMWNGAHIVRDVTTVVLTHVPGKVT